MNFNTKRILGIAIILCFVSVGVVGAVSATDDLSTDNPGTSETPSPDATQTAEKAEIEEITVTITDPVRDETRDEKATVSGEGVSTNKPNIVWDPTPVNNKFQENKIYTATITILADDTHKFTKTSTVKANGKTVSNFKIFNDGAEIEVSTTFGKTDKAPETYEPLINSFTTDDAKTGEAPLTVDFKFETVYATDFRLLQGTDQIGNSTKSSPITHTFENAGTYNIVLAATNGTKSTTSRDTITIVVTGPTNTTKINALNLTVTQPASGAKPAQTATTSNNVVFKSIQWSTKASNFLNGTLSSTDRFAADTDYYAKVTVENASRYNFGIDKPTVTVNGETVASSLIDLSGQTLTITIHSFDTTSETISSVTITVPHPVLGKLPATKADVKTAASSTYAVDNINWYRGSNTTSSTKMNTSKDKFAANTVYTAEIKLSPVSSKYAFNSSLDKSSVKVNSNSATSISQNTGNTVLTVVYTFPSTAAFTTGPTITTFSVNQTDPKLNMLTGKASVAFTYAISGFPTISTIDYGDDQRINLSTKTSGTVSHEYSSMGSFAATLTSTDDNGTSTKTLTIPVSQDVLSADFTVSPASGPAPLTVIIKDTSSGTVTSRTWDFNDGTASVTDTTATHTYENTGTYYIVLSVSNGKTTSKKTRAVTITAADAPVKEVPRVNYEPMIAIGDLSIPSPVDVIAEFIRLLKSMLDFDNYVPLSNKTVA